MELVLFSTDGYLKNTEINRQLLKFLDPSSLITFIPAGPDSEKKYFQEFKEWFGKWGYSNFQFLDLENSETSESDKAWNCDAIYLSGGNPYNFLHNILQGKNKEHLLRFAHDNKVLMGASAGAMVMGPSVGQTVFFKGIQNEFSVDEEQSLALTDFEFFPHYGTAGFFINPQTIDQGLSERAKKTDHKIVACKEGEGIIIKGNQVILIGNPQAFLPS